ncbi:MAG: NERD domain-containing protein [Anaerolineae bacterium]|nr:NERD domain-containing protein [Anaerolineae bacterium]
MKIVLDEKIIKRNTAIGRYSSLVALLILGGGIYVTFAYPDQVTLSFGALLAGFLLSQFGIYFGNRWGRRPRVDERLTAALKGMTKDYTLYHYTAPVSHLLVGPAGVWIIEPYYQRGTITYEKGRWRQKGGGFLLNYLKIFAQEGLGRPDIEIETDSENLKKFLQKEFGEQIPPINAVLAFTDDRADLQVQDAPYPALKVAALKEFFRKAAKSQPLPALEYKRITEALPQGSDEVK